MAINKKKNLILYLWEQNVPCTAAELADVLNVSVRTVKMYVKEINALAHHKVVLSSNKGYTALKISDLSFLDEPQTFAMSYAERSVYIIKKILIEHRPLNTFDLCDELFISYSTLKSDLAKMNTLYQIFHVHFSTQNDLIQIQGSEKDKRPLLSSIIRQETHSRILDLDTLKQSFSPAEIEKISQILNDFFKQGTYNLNNFSYTNLLLHFAILIERVKTGNSLSEIREIMTKNPEELALVRQLSDRIEQDFSITLNAYEKNEIYIFFKTNINYLVDSNYDKLREVIGEDVLDVIVKIMAEVSQLYSIDLKHESFIIPFGLHIKALITRASLGKYNRNPLSEKIKQDCPIIYDIAIFIALRLSEIYQVAIAEDEVAFIFLHVGTEIDRQNSSNDKLKCVLLCSDYLGLEKKIYAQLTQDYADEITIDAVVSSYEELERQTFDLLITMIQDERNYNYPSLLILPFQLDKQKNEIREKIYEIQQVKKKELIFNHFDHYFHPELFFVIENGSREDVIQKVCDKMEALGYVSASFKTFVKERENASSTAFGSIAIPHSVHMDAYQTKIGIAVSRSGITWGNNLVNIMLLIAINKYDKQILLTINESILSLFENPEILSRVKNTSSLAEFKEIILPNL